MKNRLVKKNIVKYRMLLNWLVIVLLSATVCLSQMNIAVGPINAATANQETVASLEQFNNDISSIRSAVSKSFGPYSIHSQCTWCSQHIIWCVEESSESWRHTVDFTETRQSLSRLFDQAQKHASTFSSSYEPTQAWLNALPEFSKKFDASANIILATQKDIKAGIGPNDEQRRTVTQALQELIQDLDKSSSVLQSATSALATFLQQQSAYRSDIQQAIDGADSSSRAALASLEKESQTHHCQDGVQEQYTGIKEEFSRSLQEISVAFQNLEKSSQKAEKSLAQLLGSVVSSQTDLKSILKSLEAAKNDQLGSFLEQLHLNVAQKQWSDLASYSTSYL